MSSRVLVTGSAGFTGHYVCEALRNVGFDVFGLTKDLTTTGKFLDLCNKDAVFAAVQKVKPTAAIHLAAIAYVAHGNEDDFFKVNVEGTCNLLSALRYVSGLENVVVASSANIYGNTGTATPIKEIVTPNPINAYAESKLEMEKRIREDFSDLEVTIVRPFNYTGVGQAPHFLVPKIVEAFKRKVEILELGNLDVARDFSDVRFVAEVYKSLIQKKVRGEVLNICSGRLVTLREILAMCRKITGHEMKVKSVDAFARKAEIKALCGDPMHLREVMDLVSAYSFEETLWWMLSK